MGQDNTWSECCHCEDAFTQSLARLFYVFLNVSLPGCCNARATVSASLTFSAGYCLAGEKLEKLQCLLEVKSLLPLLFSSST